MRRPPTILTVLAVVALLAAVPVAQAAPSPSRDAPVASRVLPAHQQATVTRVVDGDTIDVTVGGRQRSVRMIGIDTPETYAGPECGGTRATRSLQRELQPGDRVRLVRDRSQGELDDYGRLLRYVVRAGEDLNRLQVRRGWARVYVYDRAFDRVGRYYASQDDARTHRRGVWGLCKGGF